MKIVISGSMSSSKKMVEIEKALKESVQNKIAEDLIRDYYEEIKNADAVLIVNETKNGIKDYIGGNAFLELGYGHALRKKTFILNGIPDMPYTDEIIAMQPVILNGDINKIK